MTALRFATIEKNGSHIFQITGSADMYSYEPLEKALDELVLQQPKSLVIDLTDCQFIGSLCIGALTRLTQIMKRTGPVKLVVPPGQVRTVLDRSKVIDLFQLSESVEAATEMPTVM